MRLFLIITLTMCAFAANSVLTRAAVEGGHLGPTAFAIVRVAAGAIMLGALVMWRGGALPLMRPTRVVGAFSLTVYMAGFSLAYLSLDAGLGALILFGVTQITMFAHSAMTGQRPDVRQLSGAAIAFSGLVLVLWPGAGSVTDPIGAGLMVLAGLGWAVYSIAGRGTADPLAASAANFILCLPLICLLLLLTGIETHADITGVVLAVLSGALTSGLGYALWYKVLRQIPGTTAAVVQLSVPVIAIVAGALLLGETISAKVIMASLLVLGGIGWAVTARR
ncbi:DMT family transporter [Sulfitobacter sp. S223]|uniref:DMT family transporter n=1 Tax=Sulfitobacter sp. S223 TaxID=2867023 RepID=UPI0021A2D522|nr:DMT family transporter [Sulfitobacter sp. S223]UWR27097.1 DMT family transporter [Sulfitobacter sp. S223]